MGSWHEVSVAFFAFEVISPAPRAFPEEVGKGKKGLPERVSSHFVLTASYLNKCIRKPTSASLSIYFNWRRSDKNHTTTRKKTQKCLSRGLLFRMFSTKAYTRGTLIRLLTTTSKPGKCLTMLLVSEK